MNKIFESKFNIPNQTIETILNDWDKKILLEGGKNIVEKILKEFRGKLPDGIIYPDTSARPLFYLLDPIFTKISKEEGRDKPLIFFMKTNHPDTFTTIFEDDKGEEIFYDEVEKLILEKIKHGDVVLRNNKDYFLHRAKITAIKRNVEVDRASEIKNYNEELSGKGVIANLAVIDEFSMQGQTRKELEYAFGYELPYFSVFGNKGGQKVDEEKIGLLIDTNTFPKNPANNENTKLSYTMGELKHSVGVNKKELENKYSLTNKIQTEEDRKKVVQLRKEMKDLGVQISNNF